MFTPREHDLLLPLAGENAALLPASKRHNNSVVLAHAISSSEYSADAFGEAQRCAGFEKEEQNFKMPQRKGP
jgi:hypothetical protein